MAEQNNELARPAEDRPAGPEAEKNPPKPFEPQSIDLTPEEPVNIGYVGGVFRK